MSGFEDPSFFGDRWASSYDDVTDLDPAPAVEFLAGLAGGGRVLELAVGTGRVALPLVRRGVDVEGVEASAAMVDRLRKKAGGETMPIAIGDMADVPVDGPYDMVYLVFNTLYNLISQERQIDCFKNVARVLKPNGLFVLECFIPDLAQFHKGQQVEATVVTQDSAALRLSHHDPVGQHLTRQYVRLDAEGFHLTPVLLRYCWPSELDLMARLAGLKLRDRYADWDRTPFDARSSSHISVYERHSLRE